MGFRKITVLLLLLLCSIATIKAQKNSASNLPEPIGWVNDFEHIFTAQEVKTLDSIISEYEKETTVEISIVTIDTSMVSADNFNDYVLELANAWGVGKKDKNNGILIGFSQGYRKMRISNGYGIENILSDKETADIMNNNFLAYFKKGQYYEGTLNGLNSLITRLNEKLK